MIVNNITCTVEEDDDYKSIILEFASDYCKVIFASVRLCDVKKEEWLKLLTEKDYDIDLADENGSHCDNNCVNIKNTGEFLEIEIDTATGGSTVIKFDLESAKTQMFKVIYMLFQ